MLEVLKIKNIAIIDSAEIHFESGLNILSGETGAGKSIVIEAISLLLGSRANIDLIRSGCDEAVVEGLFNIRDIQWVYHRLKNLGFADHSMELLIKRTVHRSGRHRIYVNGELATLSVLQTLCEGLIDLCGQNEHQSLMKSSTQLDLLDRYGGLVEQAKNIAACYNKLKALIKEKDLLTQADLERTKKASFLKFQIDELSEAGLAPGEDEQLAKEKHYLQSAETRAQIAESTRQVLESDENGSLHTIRLALLKLKALAQLDPGISVIQEALERALAETEEASICLNRYLSCIEVDAERLQVVQERLSLLADLRRKYGSTIEKMIQTQSDLEAEFAALGAVEDRLNKVHEEVQSTETEFRKLGTKLSQARVKISKILAESVTSELKDLKMGEAKFKIELVQKEEISEWNSSGADFIQFTVQTNRGEPAKALGKIASGGELSRLMLAIRRVISDRGGIGVYLFDEIDAGIGGQTAFQVGRKLKSVAQYNQVICITHLPQVASFADHHIVVRKTVVGNRTITVVTELSKQARKEELARMLGGPDLTKKSLENASELLDLAVRH